MSVRPTTAALAILLAACGGAPGPFAGEPPDSSPTTSSRDPHPETTIEIAEPPEVVVRIDGDELSLSAFTACFGNACFDGLPPDPLPDLGRSDRVTVEFPLGSWEFTAEFVESGVDCPRRTFVTLERVDATTHLLTPIGPAGTYDVTLFGRSMGGDVGGDLFVAFRWQSAVDGPAPSPQATASILADHDGAVDSYGIEIPVSNLAATPATASGEVTVTSSEGTAHTFPLTRDDVVCSEGTLFFTADTSEGLAAARLGTRPFSYEITLVLDGLTFVGTATWPDDEDPECAPCVPLTFEPALPGMPGA